MALGCLYDMWLYTHSHTYSTRGQHSPEAGPLPFLVVLGGGGPSGPLGALAGCSRCHSMNSNTTTHPSQSVNTNLQAQGPGFLLNLATFKVPKHFLFSGLSAGLIK